MENVQGGTRAGGIILICSSSRGERGCDGGADAAIYAGQIVDSK